MISTSTARSHTVVLRLVTPNPSVVLLTVHDAAGRRVVERRVRDLSVRLSLPSGAYRVTATDDRRLHDPARHAGAVTTVEVDGDVESTLVLTRGTVVTATSAPWARVELAHTDGERLEVRADGHGTAVVGGLRAGSWTATAHDRRRDLCSPAGSFTAAGDAVAVDLPAHTPTARLLVDVRGGDRRPVRAATVTAVDAAGRTVTAPVTGGLADLRGLRPGTVHVVVPASVGHLGTRLDVVTTPGSLDSVTAVVPVGATVSGRVTQVRRQYAAVVALVDEDGVELERARTDEYGRFVLGTGLRATSGLTVVATSGPETLHVTQAAVADVTVRAAVRHDVGEVALPVAGPRARWTARTPAIAAMKLPSTKV